MDQSNPNGFQSGGPQGTPPVLSSDEKLWGAAAHVGVPLLVFLLWATGIGFLAYAVPFVLYFMYREKSSFVANHAKQSAGLAVLMLPLTLIVGVVLAAAAVGSVVARSGSGLVGAGALGLIYVVFIVVVCIFQVIAGIAAFSGKEYRYPIIGNFVANIGK